MTKANSEALQEDIGSLHQEQSIDNSSHLPVATTQQTVATTQQKVQAMIAEQATILDTQHTRFRYSGPINRVTSGLLGLNDQSHPQYIHLAFADATEGGPSYNETEIETGIANILQEGCSMDKAIPSLIARSIYKPEKALSSVKIQDAMRAGLIKLIKKDDNWKRSTIEWFTKNPFVSPEKSQHPDVKKAIVETLTTLIETPNEVIESKGTFGIKFRSLMFDLSYYRRIGLIDDSFLKSSNIQELLAKGLAIVSTTEGSERTILTIQDNMYGLGLFVEGWEKQPGVIETIRKCLLQELIHMDQRYMLRSSPGFGGLSVDEQNTILENALSQFNMNNQNKKEGLITSIYAMIPNSIIQEEYERKV